MNIMSPAKLLYDNISSLRRGQSKNIFIKIKKLFLLILIYPFSFILSLFEKKYIFRFGDLHSSNYGVFVMGAFLYQASIKRYRKKYIGKKLIDIFGHESGVCNNFFLQQLMKNNNFNIKESVGLAFYLSYLFRNSSKNIIPVRNEYDLFGDTLKLNDFILFTDEEISIAETFLKKINPDNMPIVTMHAKDNVFSTEVEGKNIKKCDRCADINTFKKSTNYLSKQNNFCIRMGAAQEKIDENGMSLFDYSNSGERMEFLDFYLASKSKFYIGTDSGYSATPFLFKIPMIVTNIVRPLGYFFSMTPNSIFIHKRMFSKKYNKLLNYKEIFIHYKRNKQMDSIVEDLDIIFLDNSDDEILEGTKEIVANIDGVDIRTENGKILQEKFWKIVESFNFEYSDFYHEKFKLYDIIYPEDEPSFQSRKLFNINVSAYFLEKNEYLLS